jgi:hypothetical protein
MLIDKMAAVINRSNERIPCSPGFYGFESGSGFRDSSIGRGRYCKVQNVTTLDIDLPISSFTMTIHRTSEILKMHFAIVDSRRKIATKPLHVLGFAIDLFQPYPAPRRFLCYR